MTADPAARHARLMALFHEVCDLDPGDCQRRLAALALEDAALADELKQLLVFDTQGAEEDLLDITRRGAIGAAALGAALHADRPLPEHIGRYRVLRKLGEGGMGTVLEAEQLVPKRRVALKVLRAELASERMRRRFQAEAEALARLAHPCIARVYEAVVDGPEPYLVMELVHGEPLDEYMEAHPTRLGDKVALLAKIADAVDHAHKNGVVHRDLKPPNILIEAGLAPKVLDFGIARVIDVDTQPGDRMTRSGEVMGTPSYMSPEQTMLDPERIDHRTDIYALGVVGYQLLAGRMPYAVDRSDLVKAFTTIREVEPLPAGKVRRELAGDLTIILKTALAKEPERRYASAAALADDLRRWLAHEPIHAHPPSAWYQLTRFARRNRVLVASLGALFAVLVAAVVVATSFWLSGEEARGELARRVDELVLLQARATLDDDPTRSLGWLAQLSPDGAWDEAAIIAWDAAARGVSRAVLSGHTSDVEWVDVAPSGTLVASAGYDATVRLWDLATGEGRVLSGHRGEVNRVLFSPDGTRVASAGRDGLVGVWRVRDGALRARLESPGEVEDLAWSPDGQALASVGADGVLRVWTRLDGMDAPPRVLASDHAAMSDVEWSRDGARIAAGMEGGKVRVVDVASGASQLLEGAGGPVEHVVIAPDGKTLAVGTKAGSLWLWRLGPVVDGALATDPRALVGHTAGVKGAVFVGAQTLATVDRAGELRLWDVATATGRRLGAGGGVYRDVEVSPDGRWLATASDDRTAVLWDLRSGAPPQVLRGHRGAVQHVAFTADGAALVSASKDGDLRVWSRAGARTRWDGLPGWPRAAAASPDGKTLVTVETGAVVRRLDLATQTMTTLPEADDIHAVAWSPDGARFATSRRDGVVHLWRADGALERALPKAARVHRLAFSRDGRWLAAATASPRVALWDVASGALTELLGHTDEGEGVAFPALPDALVTVGRDGRVRRASIARHDGVDLADLGGAGTGLAASPDGAWLAASGKAGRVARWHVEGEALAPAGALTHDGPALCVAVTDDGRVASGDRAGLVLILGPGADTPEVLRGHTGEVAALAFAANGRTLVSASDDRTVRVWELATGVSHTVDLFTGPVVGLAVVDDRFVALADEPALALWPLAIPSDPPQVRAWLDPAQRFPVVHPR